MTGRTLGRRPRASDGFFPKYIAVTRRSYMLRKWTKDAKPCPVAAENRNRVEVVAGHGPKVKNPMCWQ